MKFRSFVLPCCCLNYLLIVFLIGLADGPSKTLAQMQPSFELPVQLVGFPVIILSVRFTEFVRKLAYSLNPRTYMGRSRRHVRDFSVETSQAAINAAIAEKQILSDLGPKACVMEEPCKIHATRKAKRGAQPEWSDILSNYKTQSNGMKQWYLLSVFIGDEIRDAALCKQLSKRLACDRHIKLPIRD